MDEPYFPTWALVDEPRGREELESLEMRVDAHKCSDCSGKVGPTTSACCGHDRMAWVPVYAGGTELLCEDCMAERVWASEREPDRFMYR